MKKIAIVTDDNSGITPEEAKQLGIYIIKMPVLIDGTEYYEYDNLTSEQFYKFLEEDRDVKTSQPSPGNVMNLWENLLKDYDEIVHIPMSSGLSESCNTAKSLAENFDGNVFVVDNHRISVTLKRSVLDAINLRNKGYDGAAIKETLESTKGDSSIYIMVDTLKYLKKGGRVTPAGAALGATFHIKPILQIQGGKLDAKAKVIGVKKAKLKLVEFAKEDLIKRFKYLTNKGKYEIEIAYTYDKSLAEDLIKLLQEQIPDLPEIASVIPLSLSVATHIGPGAMAVAISKIIH
ncbi:MAG: DegV family protein [Firmicutes bacterium]|nr:DegV family protein [Candidatus Alectryobacillus merdavium]